MRQVYVVCPGGLEHSGGIGRLVGYLLEALARQPAAPMVRLLDSRGSGHVALSPFHLALTFWRVFMGRLDGSLGLLHIHVSVRASTWRKLPLVLLGRLLKVPVVLHLHGSAYDDFYRRLPSPARALAGLAFRSADRVVVLGRHWHDFATRELGVPAERVAIFLNAVPAPPAASRRGERTGPCRILFLGRLGARKGVPDLLAALADDAVLRLPWRAVLAGDGEVDTFRARAAALGLAERIDFTGWVGTGEVAGLLAQADILTLPSYEEGLPMAVLEAMAAGLAVVSTPVGALPEVIGHGAEGLLVTPGDVPGLAAALARLLGDGALRRQLGEAAARRFREQLDIETYARRMAELYRELAPV